MRLCIQIDNEWVDVDLFNFQYWNQRLFCLGKIIDSDTLYRFISTKGFDRLLIERHVGAKFNFKKTHFSPYLCSRDKDVWRESQLLDKKRDQFEASDIGPSEWSGLYRTCKTLDSYRDDVYFETKVYELGDFDLLKYQSNDLYFVQHQSLSKDRMPLVINLYDHEKLFNNLNIIHGVSETGSEFFDEYSLTTVCGADIGNTSDNPLYSIKRADKADFLHNAKIGLNSFLKLEEIKKLEEDCGFSYIKKYVLNKIPKKKHVFRYLYEYFNNINKIVSKRRKQTIETNHGPKEFKKEDFVPIFENTDMMHFKIVYFQNLFTSERKCTLTTMVPGTPVFQIDGYYNYIDGNTVFYDFPTATTLLEYIEKHFGTVQRMRLAKILSIWFKGTYGYVPRVVTLDMAANANSKHICNKTRVYSLPTLEEDGNCYLSTSYINFYEFLATFGLHIPKIRSLLRMDEFNDVIFKDLEFTCPIYHICRDTRRSLFHLESNDKPLSETMIPLKDAMRLLKIFEQVGDKKNSFWYRNANRLVQSFPEAFIKNLSSSYQSPSLLTYVESKNEDRV